MAIKITGNWKKGRAFDKHTLSSDYLGVDEYGHNQWDTIRSEMGELVYLLKYKSDTTTLPKIVELLDKIKGIETMDIITPIPPSNANRSVQPVRLIAEALGHRRNVRVIADLLSKSPEAKELKNVDDPKERKKLLNESMSVNEEHDISGLKILLVDDLFRSGATLEVATGLLLNEGAADVYVLTMTKTKSNR